MTVSECVPADVYAAAVRIYIHSDRPGDDDVARAWAVTQWGAKVPRSSYAMAFWVLSMAAQIGRATDVSR